VRERPHLFYDFPELTQSSAQNDLLCEFFLVSRSLTDWLSLHDVQSRVEQSIQDTHENNFPIDARMSMREESQHQNNIPFFPRLLRFIHYHSFEISFQAQNEIEK
jgi:hypothetical protein